jgi:hypothetical protein
MVRGGLGAFGAIALAVAMVVLGRAPAYARSFTHRPPQSSRSTKSRAAYAEVAADEASGPKALGLDGSGEDAMPSAQDIRQRHRQYASAFAFCAGLLLGAIVIALSLKRRAAAAAGIAALAALGMGALLQFTASKGLPMFLWPPPHLWLGTFAADFMLAVMFAAVGGVLMRPGMRRVAGSILIAEVAWWGIPAFAGAAGLTLGIARHRMDMDWLMFLGTAVGAVAAPAAGWATASLAAALAERIVPGRT